jgi:hypothetical protein
MRPRPIHDVRARLRQLTLRRALGLLGVAVLALVLLAAVGLFIYFGALAHHAPADVRQSVLADPTVTVERAYGGYVVSTADSDPVGVVFYPGARVEPDAYLPTAARIATRADVTVVVPEMRLNLAVLSQGRAADVVAGEPGIERWVVGGHSLGGAMACRYAGATDRPVEGLLLVGAYCDRPVRGMPALSVVGTRDAVLNRERFAATRSNLPESRAIVRIEGMNHSQAGWYGGQRGDRPSRITTPEAHRRLAATVAAWLCRSLDHCPDGAVPAGSRFVELSFSNTVSVPDRSAVRKHRLPHGSGVLWNADGAPGVP